MLTRGTVLAEALAAGTGMYITDVAIYMQVRMCVLVPLHGGGYGGAIGLMSTTAFSLMGMTTFGRRTGVQVAMTARKSSNVGCAGHFETGSESQSLFV